MKGEAYKALALAQSEFESAFKDSTNPHFHSSYSSLDACVEAVRPALNKYELYLLQDLTANKDSVTVKTVFLHSSGVEIKAGELTIPVTKLDAQGFGSAITYARRYSLLSACGIAPSDDDGNGAVGNTWFSEKFLPLMLNLTRAGKFHRNGQDIEFTTDRALVAIKSYLEGKATEEILKNSYNHYKEQL
jgi:hypothetical protein